MKLRLVIEVLYVLASVAAVIGVWQASAWAYPRARDDIWVVMLASVAVVALLGVRQFQRALTEDRTSG